MSLRRNRGLNVTFIKMILIITSNLQYGNYRFCLTINIYFNEHILKSEEGKH